MYFKYISGGIIILGLIIFFIYTIKSYDKLSSIIFAFHDIETDLLKQFIEHTQRFKEVLDMPQIKMLQYYQNVNWARVHEDQNLIEKLDYYDSSANLEELNDTEKDIKMKDGIIDTNKGIEKDFGYNNEQYINKKHLTKVVYVDNIYIYI